MTRSVLRYWLLLLLPTLVIAGAAYRLLQYEQARLDDSFRAAHLDRARSVARGLKQTVQVVEDTLLSALKNVPPETVAAVLPVWVGQNPLVRNVFIWSSHGGLRYPPPGMAANREEHRFIRRYSRLFDGSQAWPPATKDPAADAQRVPPGATVSPPRQKTAGLSKKPAARSGRDSLLDLARNRAAASRTAPRSSSPGPRFEGGWIPWFTDNRLYIIGWVRPAGRDLVWGLELELSTLLSRLIPDFSLNFPEGHGREAIYVLKDGTGRILHQSVGDVLDPDRVPDLSVSLSPQLPHWQVAVYFTGNGAGHATGRGFLIISGLLVALVLAALLIGGFLLFRESERNRRDARRKTTFVANVSHELKTPLTSIRMYAELLMEGRAASEEKRKSYLRVIVDESRRLARLVNNLLDFSRLEQGRKKYRLERFCLSDFLGEFIDAHRMPIEKEGLSLSLRLPEESAHILFDRDVLEQVLLNLVDNAVKYAASGGELSLVLQRATLAWQLDVMDRGPGIPAGDRPRIFEKFYRGNDSLTADHPGSGLGLSIARRLMRDMGGDLEYEARAGGGSCFKIVISDPEKQEKRLE